MRTDLFLTNLRKRLDAVAKKARKEFYTLKKGQRFQECDKRFVRIIEIVGFDGDRVKIKTIFCEPNPYGKSLGRETTARRDRFHRRSNGYRRMCGHCTECQLKRGAEMPKGELRGVTCTLGICEACLKPGSSLVPDCDFNWPKEGRRAIFD